MFILFPKIFRRFYFRLLISIDLDSIYAVNIYNLKRHSFRKLKLSTNTESSKERISDSCQSIYTKSSYTIPKRYRDIHYALRNPSHSIYVYRYILLVIPQVKGYSL